MVKLLIYALLAYVAYQFVRRFLAGLGAPARTQPGGTQASRGQQPGAAPGERRQVAQDLVQCSVCGHYVATRCSRADCPQ